MRRALLIVVLIAVVVAVAFLWHPRRPAPVYESAYAADGHISVFNSTAEVRASVATLNFGERVDILQREKDFVQVRTPGGAIGWVEPRQLISQEIWQRAADLTRKAGDMPVQAFGHTRVPSNLHLGPGREAPRLMELGRDVPVQMLERHAVELPAPATPAPASKPASPQTEEWWMIRTSVKDIGPVAGWTLARFIALDAPAPLPDYSTAAAMRLISWFTLNRVSDGNGGEKPQYLTAGLKSSTDPACDFNMLRVYTWGEKSALRDGFRRRRSLRNASHSRNASHFSRRRF